MTLFTITRKNMLSNLSRSGLLIFGLVVAVTTITSLYLISSAMKKDFADKVDEYGTNVVIVPKSKNLSLSYAGMSVGGIEYESANLHENDIAKLKTIKNKQNLAIIAPKLLGVSEIKGKQAMIAGVSFEDELKIKKWWEIGSGRKPSGKNDVLLGGNVAKKLKLKPGDRINLENKGELNVVGVLRRVGTNEDDLAYISLPVAQSVFGKQGQLSMIEVAAWCTSCPLEEIVRQASAKLPNAKVSGVLQAAKARDALIGQFIAFSMVLSAIIVIVTSLIIYTNMMSSVRSRKREIGIFRAVGYRGLHILKIILLESFTVGIVSGVSGYIIGLVIARYAAPGVAGIDLYIPGFDAGTAYVSILGTLFISLLASIYPAIKASRLNPTIALTAIN